MHSALIELVAGTVLLLGSRGPVPITLAAMRATYRIRRGLPCYVGNLSGLFVAMIAAGIGLAVLFATFAGLKLAFKIAGGLFMVYVAWKLSSAPASSNNVCEAAEHAPSLVNGLTLSVLNPKACVASMAIFSQFMLPFSSASRSLALTGSLCLLLVVVINFVGLSCGRLIAPPYRAGTAKTRLWAANTYSV